MKLHKSTFDTGNEVYEGFHLRKRCQLLWYAHLEDVENAEEECRRRRRMQPEEGAWMLHSDP